MTTICGGFTLRTGGLHCADFSYFVAEHQRVRLVELDENLVFVLNQRLQVVGQLLLHQRESQPCPGAPGVCSHRGQVADTQRHVLRFRAVLLDALQQIPKFLLRAKQPLLRSQAMTQDMFQDDEEMLQWQVIRVQLTAVAQRLLEQLLHHELADVDEIRALDGGGVAR